MSKPVFTQKKAVDQILDSDQSTEVVDARKWGPGSFDSGATLTYSYMSEAQMLKPDHHALDQAEIVRVESYITLIEDVADIHLQRIPGYSNEGDIRIHKGSTSGGDTIWSTNPRSGPDEIRDPRVVTDSAVSQRVTLHELLHAVGLHHPGPYNGDSATYDQATHFQDSAQYSIMSYWAGSKTGASYNTPSSMTLMIHDVLALQRLYGANTSAFSGNTTYGFNSNTNRDVWSLTNPSQNIFGAIWDSKGIDTIDASKYKIGGHIDLRESMFSSLNGEKYNLSIVPGAIIENAIGGYGDDIIYGNAAANTLEGNDGHDTIDGGAGSDTLYGGTGNDLIYGATDNDFIYGDAGNDSLYGGSGNDTVDGRDGNDLVDGGDGNDSLYGGYGSDTLYGGAGNDLIYGVTDNDFIYGDAGNDSLYGGSGNDTVDGRDGNDLVDGGDGNDSLYGGYGSDTLYGGAGNDLIYGVTDNDFIYGDAGNDSLYGGSGNDTLDGGSGNDTLDGGDGGDSLIGGTGNDYMVGGSNVQGADYHDTMRGGDGNDRLYGGDDNDWLYGDNGNDYLNGGIDDDHLYGGSGNDVLVGGTGKDEMVGGAGADWFKFSANDTKFGLSNADIVFDFKWWEGDKIDLTATSVSYFGGEDSYPEANEVSYWWYDYDSDGDKDTIVSFNDGGVKDIVLHNTIELVMIESDFIL